MQNYPDCSRVCSVLGRCPFHHPLVHGPHSLHLPHAERELTIPACCCDHRSKGRPLLKLECKACGLAPTGKVGPDMPEKGLWKITSCPHPKKWIPLTKNPLLSVPLLPLDCIAVPLSNMAPQAPVGAQLGKWAAQWLEHSNREATGKSHAGLRMGCECCAREGCYVGSLGSSSL